MTVAREVDLPPGIRRLIADGVRRLEPDRILLYGSRARGDHDQWSDWDLCFDGVKDRRAWTFFSFDAHEDPPTLLPFDAVLLEEAPEPFRSNMLRDGVAVYSKSPS